MKVKVLSNGKWFPVDMEREANAFAFAFPYNPGIVEEMRTLDLVGPGWQGHAEPPRKVWLAHDSPRTRFRLDAMLKDRPNPYARYDQVLPKFELADRPYLPHQQFGVSFVWTTRQCILAWEMGTMKTLVAIRVMEKAKEELGWQDSDFWYIAPKAASEETKAQYLEWESKVHPKFTTYEGMVSAIAKWPKGEAPPKFVVFDESTKLKSSNSQRWKAAMHLTQAMRQEWGSDAFVVLMSGSPAPKNPSDWWPQCEVACPGFVREGSLKKFEQRLAIVKLTENHETGGKYPKFVAWLDDERKCAECGQPSDSEIHSPERRLANVGHVWKKSINEVSKLYDRLKGFVSVKFKKDVLELPPRVHKVIRCKPTQQVLNAAKLILKRAPSAVQAMILLRELSDGFQYREEVAQQVTCVDCAGSGTMVLKFDPEAPGEPLSEAILASGKFAETISSCDLCQGTGVTDVTKRVANRVACPKDEALMELIEEHEDAGRLVTYAGFTGSVDRIVDVHLRMGWSVVRVDGRGWTGFAPPGEPELRLKGRELYRAFRFGQVEHPKLAFVAQASSAGHGLNLTASPTEIFYSNDFNFESRIQAEERNNRMGIQTVLDRTGRKSILVVDLVHLETDVKILDNHKVKRALQAMTLGEIGAALEA